MLRIIAGKYRGRKINQPPLSITRPTTDRIREAIFSSIQFQIQDSIVLDLFAGSGANSIEASSRGARKIFSIDNNIQSTNIIKENLDLLKIENINVFQMNAIDFLKRNSDEKFNFIFIDPPHKEYNLYNNSLELIEKNNLLSSNGIIVIETDNISKIKIPTKFIIKKEKKYGKVYILQLINNI